MALGGGLARLLLQHQVHSLKRILTTFSRVLDTFNKNVRKHMHFRLPGLPICESYPGKTLSELAPQGVRL